MVEITVPEVSCVFVVGAIHNLDVINTCNHISELSGGLFDPFFVDTSFFAPLIWMDLACTTDGN